MSVTVINHPSPNFDARQRPIDLVVLHYTGMQDARTALARLCDPAPVAGMYPGPWQSALIEATTPLARVSSHYVIDPEGAIFGLVPEDQRAWHAGVSFWAGLTEVNHNSIGIEVVNGGHDFGLPAYTDTQIAALITLLTDICARYDLRPHRVVGHSDVAPVRKLDPGEHFPWAKLAAAGVALGPSAPLPATGPVLFGLGAEGTEIATLQEALGAIGYGVLVNGMFDQQTEDVVKAFHRRFRPSHLAGDIDAASLALIDDLLDQITRLNFRRPSG